MEVSYLGAGDDTTRCLIYLLAAPPVPLRTTIHLQEGLDFRAMCIGFMMPDPAPFNECYAALSSSRRSKPSDMRAQGHT
jgi:hypothetical protein